MEITNVLIHRDYLARTESTYISVTIYNDRTQIINSRALYGTSKIEEGSILESKNPAIIRLLEEKDSVIENRHFGIPTMKREMRQYNLVDPEFHEERDYFKVVFKNVKLKCQESMYEQISGQVEALSS